MIRPICKDVDFLRVKSEAATKEDIAVAIDLLDTLNAHRDHCVGMAANMIGISKRIIVVNMGPLNIAMINPTILSKKEPYSTEEGCLSLTGTRGTMRYKTIRVEFRDMQFQVQRRDFTGWIAQIIQHEIDHCDGILI